MSYSFIEKQDDALHRALIHEDNRQEHNLEMIASENFASKAVMEAYTSTLTNKYAEGYPGKRYYGGCDPSDEVENLAIERACKIYDSKFANVQPHSGAQANTAVFMAALEPGDTFLAMDLAHGGHLTHGMKINFSGVFYKPIHYGVRKEDYLLDYDSVRALAREHRPKMIIAGASAYPRIIDFKIFKEIANEINALFMVDMAHISGLVAGGMHPSPIPYADFVTTTTHKTLRGPRGGLILTQEENWAKKVNSRLFPGTQGGPLMHVIAAKAAAFHEALQPEFKTYIQQVVKNSATLAESLQKNNIPVLTSGTDNHLLLLNTFSEQNITGKVAQELLENVGITCNKNALPFDVNKPAIASGIRLGTAALTTRGMNEPEMEIIGENISDILLNPDDQVKSKRVLDSVQSLCSKFPMKAFRLYD
jgi:glycine hydroxymethyltransferase